jgi:hypothetical protein
LPRVTQKKVHIRTQTCLADTEVHFQSTPKIDLLGPRLLDDLTVTQRLARQERAIFHLWKKAPGYE